MPERIESADEYLRRLGELPPAPRDEWPEEQRGDVWYEANASNGAADTVIDRLPPGTNGQQPEPRRRVTAADVATIDDLVRAGSQVRWLWPGWIPLGVCSALAAEGGKGKTRLCADLMRRMRHQLPWPDGEPMAAPADALWLWVLADNHHDEIVTLARDFDIVPNFRFNTLKTDPFGGVSLDTAEDLGALDTHVAAVQPLVVVIDTVGNATDRNLSRQEDAKAFYFPLQVIARRYSCAMLCLTHLNATGHFLGRRVREKVRVAIRMDKPDPQDERRSLAVVKSNSRVPPALGLTMGDTGNEYDSDPPKEPEALDPGQQRPDPAVDRCAAELQKKLANGIRHVHVLRTQLEEAGYSSKTIYAAKARLRLEEYRDDRGRKCWSAEGEIDPEGEETPWG